MKHHPLARALFGALLIGCVLVGLFCLTTEQADSQTTVPNTNNTGILPEN